MGQMEPEQIDVSFAAEPPPPGLRFPERGLHVWDLLRPTINHDLPNLLVALQGLLQMLRSEEAARLSPAGQEYLKRLSAVALKLQGTVTSLRQISKAGNSAAAVETVNLPELLRELAAAARQSSPRAQVVFQATLQASQVRAPRALLFQALSEIVNLLAHWSGHEEFRCVVAARPVAGGTEIALGVREGERTGPVPAASPLANPPLPAPVFGAWGVDYNFFGSEQRLGLVLADELVWNLGGRLETRKAPGPWKWVCLTMPQPKKEV